METTEVFKLLKVAQKEPIPVKSQKTAIQLYNQHYQAQC